MRDLFGPGPRSGFSLIEVIAVLVLLGILALTVGLMVGPVVQRYTLERDAIAAQGALQVAAARMAKELSWAQSATVAVSDGGRTLSWQSAHPQRAGDGLQVLSWNGTAGAELTLNGAPLLQQVVDFNADIAGGMVRLRMAGAPVANTPIRLGIRLRSHL